MVVWYTLLFLLASCARAVDPPQKVFAQLDTLIQSQEYREATLFARDLLKQHPRSVRLQRVLGDAEFLQGHFPQAAEALGIALEKGGGGFDLYRTLGMTHLYLGRFKEAEQFLRRASAIDPTDAGILKTRGYLHYYLGEGRQAVELFQRVKGADPTDTEALVALDALMGLTGQWSAAQMVWTTDPNSGVQLCTPGGWVREVKEELTPAGKRATIVFADPPPDEEGRLRIGQALVLSVVQNAALHPLPKLPKGPWRKGEKIEGGKTRYYAMAPHQGLGSQTMARDPALLAGRLSQELLERIPEGERDLKVYPWVGLRGQATYCLGRASGRNRFGHSFVAYSMGIYDPVADTFTGLVLYGPYDAREQVEPLAQVIFNLALFGGVVGVPPVPPTFVSPEEYQARIEGFLQAGQAARAVTEAKEAIRAYPRSAPLYELLGQAQGLVGQQEEALAAYRKSHDLGGSTLSLQLGLGALALTLDRPKEAEQAYLRALELKPSDPKMLLQLGLASYRQGRMDRALELFQRAQVEAPHLEEARTYAEAIKGFQTASGSPLLHWFRSQRQDVSFCYPAGWAKYELAEKGKPHQVLLTPNPVELTSPQFETGLLYVQYDQASSQFGKREERVKPKELPEGFITHAFDQIPDPQKVALPLSPLHRRGPSRYLIGGYSYTEGSRRWTVQVFSYYEPAKDRLHVLTFRTPGTDLGEWAAFVEACFQTARFGE